ncbi:RNA-binding signal recognition particle subunit srp14 [Lathyrus oleraceus]|uniref:Signal recognition particle 14 kDa protein n=1 Tax=Pisum sativum TaxID=3888 RepID=A0A9D4W073_PEA|nr:RNA-binding signal recognition particle subunit srp14 [Pisum sativum]
MKLTKICEKVHEKHNTSMGRMKAYRTGKVLLRLDPFLNKLTSMFERSTDKASVWVTLKRSSLKSKVWKNKLVTAGETIEYE